MNTIEIKSNFHRLIDKIENDSILTKFYEILEQVSGTKDGQLWDRLNEEEKEELLKIDDDSNNDENLISHSQIKTKHKKWLD